MTRTWILRILRGTGASLLLGACLGGLEATIGLRSGVTEMLLPLPRLQLWALGAGSAGAIAGLLGLVLSAAVGAVAGHDPETMALALDTDRDPRHPWLPWVLGCVLAAVGTLLVLPMAFRLPAGAEARAIPLIGLPLVAAAAFAIGARFFLRRVDHTGKGAGVALLGLPVVLVLSMSLAVSAPMRGSSEGGGRAREGLPNVLLISVDGLRADHVGPSGRVRTGTLNWLAAHGVRFEQATTPSTAEGPPAGALLTGMHPLNSGFVADGQRLPARVPGEGKPLRTLAEILRGEGFRTGAFVSSAALEARATGLDRGFEVYDDAVHGSLAGSAHLTVPTLRRWLRWARRGRAEAPEILRPAAATLIQFERWLAYHYDENFFAWVHLSDPRMPHLMAEGQEGALVDPIPGEAGRGYGARVAQLDEVLGELIKALEQDGLMERTLIVVVGTRGLIPGSARPSVGEPWARVPAILHGPGLQEGVVLSQQVRLEDMAPTVLSAAGLRRARLADGVSLVTTMNDSRSLTRLRALTVAPPRADGQAAVALRAGRWKFVRDPRGTSALYDLVRDPEELHDRSDTAPEGDELRSALRELVGKSTPRVVVSPPDPGRAAQLRGLESTL